MSETFDPKQALALCETAGKAASGWRGRFFYDAERGDLGYIADACDRKECDCEQKLNSDGDQDCSVSLGAVECEVDDCGADIAAMLNAVAPLSTALPMAARRVMELEGEVASFERISERVHTLTAERDAALREADRLRHGVPVEGDHVCPAELERDSARAEVERLTKERDAYRAGLADLFARVSNGYEVTGEFRHRLRDLLKNGPAPREAGIE